MICGFVYEIIGLTLIGNSETLLLPRDERWADHNMDGALWGCWRGERPQPMGEGNSRYHCLKGTLRNSRTRAHHLETYVAPPNPVFNHKG